VTAILPHQAWPACRQTLADDPPGRAARPGLVAG